MGNAYMIEIIYNICNINSSGSYSLSIFSFYGIGVARYIIYSYIGKILKYVILILLGQNQYIFP